MTYFLRKLRMLYPVLAFLFSSHQLNAQLCSGSLGSPVVNITFGSGTVTPGSIPGFKTTYPYVGTSCPLDGNYTIATNSPNCFVGTWWTLNTDHTPNSVNGDMMIVNASNVPSDFFVDTVSGLCNSTTYEFAAWLLNLNVPSACGGNPVKADITFSIETVTGSIIQQYQTGSIPVANSALWKQYGFYFTAPANSGTVVIRMRNNAPGGCGNDLAIDDITLRPCGPKVTVSTSTSSHIIKSCDADTAHFTFLGNISSGFSNNYYQWQQSKDTGKTWVDISGATNSTYYLGTNNVGYYLYRLTAADGTSTKINDCSRVISDTIFYTRNISPSSNLIKNITVCTGDTIAQNGNPSYSYQWTGPASFSSNLVNLSLHNIKLGQAGKYFAKISNAVGCSITDSFLLQVLNHPVAWATPDTGICYGDTITLKGGGGSFYVWKPSSFLLTPNDSITKAFPIAPVTYELFVSNGICTDSQSVNIVIWQKPTAYIAPLQTIGSGQSEILSGQITGTDVSYNWSPLQYLTNAGSLNPTASPISTTTYYLTVNSPHNCGTATDSAVLKVNNSFFIPNALAPSATGNQDVSTLKVYGSVKSAIMMVYNQWGQIIFQTDNATIKGWDGSYNGKVQPSGVYVYTVKITYFNNKTETRSGSINLIR